MLFSMFDLSRIEDFLWEIDAGWRGDMRVPARVFADQGLLETITDSSLEQLVNVSTLPGIVDWALAMPDVHQGYGFPVGGVCATDATNGVISPGGVGYDINCGVRLLSTGMSFEELGPHREALVHELSRRIPTGRSRDGFEIDHELLERVLVQGPSALVHERDIGTAADIEYTESRGCLPGADPTCVSDRARSRGRKQLGTLGSGNHFLELERVSEVFDQDTASAYGIGEGEVCVLIHSGSRGLGHQVCTDYVKQMDRALSTHGIELPDRQLSCAPVQSAEGGQYIAAMAAAANFAWANRHVIAHRVREAIAVVLGADAASGVGQVYDVAHNVCKFEQHSHRRLCVHRKGATRAFGPGAADLPSAYQNAGQPVFIPGSMGTHSFVLAGRSEAMDVSFGTTCHGAGRALSRTQAKKIASGASVRSQLAASDILVRSASTKGLAEEAPLAYKPVDEVVDVVERAGLCKRIAKLVPIGVVKG
jgi:tRNA-splicing ligase RtcB (3'-phosphate/5'-hydroxy nucleic acid ligase)